MNISKVLSTVLISSTLTISAMNLNAQQASLSNPTTSLYTSLGEQLLHYSLNTKDGTVRMGGEPLLLSANLQYAAISPQKDFLYVVSSNAGSGTSGSKGSIHQLSAYKIAPSTGHLTPWGEPVALKERPIHLTLDRKGNYALVAYNQSGSLSVHSINQNKSVGALVKQPKALDAGIFTHQVMVSPNNNSVIALARGNDAKKTKPEDLGSINNFSFDEGKLTLMSQEIMEPGVGPRHLAFHPTQPWVYAAIERTSKLFMYPLNTDGSITKDPLFKKEALQDIHNEHFPRQRGGVVKIHPNGNFIYVSNRSDKVKKVDGKNVLIGGENNMAVFRIDPQSGEPQLLSHVDTHGVEARTFSIDPSGKWMIIANQKSLWVEKNNQLIWVPANLAVFHIAENGSLQFVDKYEMEDKEKWLLWNDIISH